jgi:hypothetical protein
MLSRVSERVDTAAARCRIAGFGLGMEGVPDFITAMAISVT